jgi:hypothetical protein
VKSSLFDCFIVVVKTPVNPGFFILPYLRKVNNSTIHYQESQRFSKWLLFVIFLPALISLVLMLRYVEKGEEWAAWIGFGVALLVGFLMSFAKLESSLTSEGVSVRFFPFIQKNTRYSFEAIESVVVVDYKPLREYGGWGLRLGKNGVAYSVSGKHGVLITFKEPQKLMKGLHKTLLIGTQKPDEWRHALNRVSQ